MSDHHELCLLYDSGELPGDQRAAFEVHRAGCPACRELLEALGVGRRAARAAELAAPARLAVVPVTAVPAARAGRSGGAVLVAAALAVLAVWPRRCEPVPSARELDRDIAALSAAVERLGAELERSETELEIDADLRALEFETRRDL